MAGAVAIASARLARIDGPDGVPFLNIRPRLQADPEHADPTVAAVRQTALYNLPKPERIKTTDNNGVQTSKSLSTNVLHV